MLDKTDQQLIAEHLAGDPQAFNLLAERYLTPLYGFLYRYVNNSADAEDLSQEVFVKVWRYIARYNQDKKFKTWLFTIAKNTALDFLKKKKMLNFSDLINAEGDSPAIDHLPDPAPLPDEIFDRADLATTLDAALSKLPSAYRQVLELYYREEFNLREIAEILDISIDTIKSRHRRALIMLRPLLVE